MKKFVVPIFFATFLFLGVWVVRDYGIAWDEHHLKEVAFYNLAYIRNGDEALFSQPYHKIYGPVFAVAMELILRVLRISDTEQEFYIRHFLNFLMFFSGVFVFYLLAKRYFGDWRWGLFAAFLLVLSPRIFADGFYNSKDIPFMSLFIVSVYTLVLFLEKPSLRSALVHAAASSFLTGIRMPGAFIIILTLVFFGLHFFLIYQKAQRHLYIMPFFAYLSASFALIVTLWPVLWTNPAANFFEILSAAGKFPWRGDVFYLGTFFKSSALPWHYILIWIFITTPVIYLVFAGFGVIHQVFLSGSISKSGYARHYPVLIFFLWLIVPVSAVIGLRAVIYDGWRHLYFIYPALVLFAVIGLREIFSLGIKALSAASCFFLIFNLFAVAYFMIRYHPYQNLYFNFLIGSMERARANFDLDYWGLAFGEGLKFIALHDKGEKITVFLDYGHKKMAEILPEYARQRILPVGRPDEAKYILSNYRWKNYDALPHSREIYSVTVAGAKVMSVFQMR